jgi:competence protein ComEA
VGGAVEKPGVYELAIGSRVNEALIMAGGLSLRADRSWVGRYLNRAQTLGDGVKIYVPEVGESIGSATLEESLAGHPPTAQQAVQGVISINTGSKTELDSLWGIGEIRAEAIISNRPYQNIEELKIKANIPQNVIDANINNISL